MMSQMSIVKRWRLAIGGSLAPDAQGPLVWYEDYERLTRERDEAKQYGSAVLLTRCGELEMANERLRAALLKYGAHDRDCAFPYHPCDCGYGPLREEIEWLTAADEAGGEKSQEGDS